MSVEYKVFICEMLTCVSFLNNIKVLMWKTNDLQILLGLCRFLCCRATASFFALLYELVHFGIS